MRKFLLVAAVFILAWIFVVPSCATRFGCEAAGGAVARADDGECPSDVADAGDDRSWAADRLASLTNKRITTGRFYDEDGTEFTIDSRRDDNSERAIRIMRDIAGRFPMTPTAVLLKADLAGPGNRQLVAAGVFYLRGTVCRVTFESTHGLGRFLDFYLGEADDTMNVVLHLTSQGEKFSSANLRFQLNHQHQIAAAVLIATDKHGHNHSWMTQGRAGRDDVSLAHDSWNPEQTTFPPASFITIDELRSLVRQWVFDTTLPPLAVRWIAVPDVGWS